MSEWIEFKEQQRLHWRGVTQLWHVVAKDGGDFLGTIKWYASWRQYSFFPNGNTVYEHHCLHAIADFCRSKTILHRSMKQAGVK